LNDTAEGNSLIDQQMGAISTHLVVARADLAQKQAAYARVSQLVKSGRAADLLHAVASPVNALVRAGERSHPAGSRTRHTLRPDASQDGRDRIPKEGSRRQDRGGCTPPGGNR